LQGLGLPGFSPKQVQGPMHESGLSGGCSKLFAGLGVVEHYNSGLALPLANVVEPYRKLVPEEAEPESFGRVLPQLYIHFLAFGAAPDGQRVGGLVIHGVRTRVWQGSPVAIIQIASLRAAERAPQSEPLARPRKSHHHRHQKYRHKKSPGPLGQIAHNGHQDDEANGNQHSQEPPQIAAVVDDGHAEKQQEQQKHPREQKANQPNLLHPGKLSLVPNALALTHESPFPGSLTKSLSPSTYTQLILCQAIPARAPRRAGVPVSLTILNYGVL